VNRLARAAHSHYSRRCRHVSKAPRTEIAPSLFDHGETGLNKTLGDDTPVDAIYRYPHVYWSNVAPQIQVPIRYLNVRRVGGLPISCTNVCNSDSINRVSQDAL
jgi:hypothetical protein